MNRRRMLVVALLLAFAAAGCSDSEQSAKIIEVEPVSTTVTTDQTQDPVQADTAPPGTIYVSSTVGNLLTYSPATGSSQVIWTANPDYNATTIGPADQGTQLDVMMMYPATVEMALFTLGDGDAVEVENGFVSELSPCLGRNAAASTSVAHNVVERTNDGFVFAAVEFTSEGQVSSSTLLATERVSTVCPQWSTDRDVVVTSTFPIDGDRVTISSRIERDAESFEVLIEGCQVTPSSFSPDSSLLALAVICFDDAWAQSGLYLADMATLRDGLTIDDLTKVADGNANRSSWHPDGEWIAVQGNDSVEDQAAPGPRSSTPTAQIVHVTTGETTPIVIDDVAVNHVIWLASEVG